MSHNSHNTYMPRVERATSVHLRLAAQTPHPNWVDLVVLFFGHQLYSAVRAPLACKDPVGDGADHMRGGVVRDFLPSVGINEPGGRIHKQSAVEAAFGTHLFSIKAT
jgi:hypothetical protein